MLGSDLEQTIARYYESIPAVLGGNAEPQKELWSRREAVTLANPLGAAVRGWADVEEALNRAASGMRDGELISHDRVSEYETADLAYIHVVERSRLRSGQSDEFATASLRTTTIWRREEHGWRIALRHADPITTPRPLETAFER